MNIGKIELKPLPGKHYSTEIEVEVGGNNWDTPGRNFLIKIAGSGTEPSYREFEKGYYAGEGMDHVESKEHLHLAEVIMEALRK